LPTLRPETNHLNGRVTITTGIGSLFVLGDFWVKIEVPAGTGGNGAKIRGWDGFCPGDGLQDPAQGL
jgi:hypothetical protein